MAHPLKEEQKEDGPMKRRTGLISGSLLIITVYFSGTVASGMLLFVSGKSSGAAMGAIHEKGVGMQAAASPSLEVEHSIEGKSVQLYFSTQYFKLTRNQAAGVNRAGEGHILLWVDGKLTRHYAKEVEIPLSSGSHKFAVELAKPDNTPYANTRIEFVVTLP
jgi:hypothetical protein